MELDSAREEDESCYCVDVQKTTLVIDAYIYFLCIFKYFSV